MASTKRRLRLSEKRLQKESFPSSSFFFSWGLPFIGSALSLFFLIKRLAKAETGNKFKNNLTHSISRYNQAPLTDFNLRRPQNKNEQLFQSDNG